MWPDEADKYMGDSEKNRLRLNSQAVFSAN